MYVKRPSRSALRNYVCRSPKFSYLLPAAPLWGLPNKTCRPTPRYIEVLRSASHQFQHIYVSFVICIFIKMGVRLREVRSVKICRTVATSDDSRRFSGQSLLFVPTRHKRAALEAWTPNELPCIIYTFLHVSLIVDNPHLGCVQTICLLVAFLSCFNSIVDPFQLRCWWRLSIGTAFVHTSFDARDILLFIAIIYGVRCLIL